MELNIYIHITPLYLAIEKENIEIIKLLLISNMPSINTLNTIKIIKIIFFK